MKRLASIALFVVVTGAGVQGSVADTPESAAEPLHGRGSGSSIVAPMPGAGTHRRNFSETRCRNRNGLRESRRFGVLSAA